MTNHIFSAYFAQIVNTISVLPRVPKDIIDKYHFQARIRVDMHYIYVHARRDPAKTWVMGPFQITLTKVETIMTDWEISWKHNVPLEEIVESEAEEEETSTDKKEEEEDKDEDEEEEEEANEEEDKEVIEVTKMVIMKKHVTRQTKKVTAKKNKMTTTVTKQVLHEIATSQCSLVYHDMGLITSRGSLKYGGGEFTKYLRVLV